MSMNPILVSGIVSTWGNLVSTTIGLSSMPTVFSKKVNGVGYHVSFNIKYRLVVSYMFSPYVRGSDN